MAGKKISQLPSGSLVSLPLSGLTAVVHSGVTHQHNLGHLRQILVDSGSHYFTGSQVINGNLTISGSITAQQYILSSSITNIVTETISGSSNFGNSSDDKHTFTGSMFVSGGLVVNGIWDKEGLYVSGPTVLGGTTAMSGSDAPKLHVKNSGSINIAHFEGNNEHYAQVNITNLNSGSLASSDLVLTADNGNETVYFVDLGINSSTYNGGYVGYENDAYLLNVGKDLYIGTVGGTNHHAELKLFANNSWENPQITIHTGSQITFNTSSFTEGYTYEFSGSLNLHNELNVNGSVTASYFIGDGSQLTNLPIPEFDVSMFLSSSTFTSASASFDQRIIDATNEQDLSSYATISSLNQITSSVNSLINATSSYLTSLGSGLISGSSQISFTGITDIPSGLVSGSPQISYTGITDVPIGIVSSSAQILEGSNILSGSVSFDGLVSGSPQISYTGITDVPSGLVSGSSQISYNGLSGLPTDLVVDSDTGSFLVTGSVSSNILTLTKGDGTTFDLTLPVGGGGGSVPAGTVSGSIQVDHNLTTNYVANEHINHTGVTISAGNGLLGGGDITTSRTLTLDTGSSHFTNGVKSKMNTENVVSGSLQITNFGFATTGSGTIIGNEVISGSLVVTGSVTIVGSITERLVLKIGSGSAAINFDYNSGSIFYLSGSLGNNTFNVQNIPTTAQRSTALTFVIEQGATPYSASAYQFDGVSQTVKWANGATPTGNANKTDVIGLTAFRSGSSWNILGTLSTFG